MRTINLILTFLIMNLLSHYISASYIFSNDSLQVNENYMLLLNDDTKINGKLTKIDSVSLQVILENDDVLKIQRNEIKQIIKKNIYGWLLSAGFQYGIPFENHDYPGSSSNNPRGFDLSVSKRINKNLWLKIEYSLMLSKNSDSYSDFEFSEKFTEHNFNILFSLQKVSPDVIISPVISAGFSFSENLEKYQSRYSDYYNQTDSHNEYEDNIFYTSILFQGGLDIRIYKNCMISCKTSISISIFPFFLFNSKNYIPFQIGTSLGI